MRFYFAHSKRTESMEWNRKSEISNRIPNRLVSVTRMWTTRCHKLCEDFGAVEFDQSAQWSCSLSDVCFATHSLSICHMPKTRVTGHYYVDYAGRHTYMPIFGNHYSSDSHDNSSINIFMPMKNPKVIGHATVRLVFVSHGKSPHLLYATFTLFDWSYFSAPHAYIRHKRETPDFMKFKWNSRPKSVTQSQSHHKYSGCRGVLAAPTKLSQFRGPLCVPLNKKWKTNLAFGFRFWFYRRMTYSLGARIVDLNCWMPNCRLKRIIYFRTKSRENGVVLSFVTIPHIDAKAFAYILCVFSSSMRLFAHSLALFLFDVCALVDVIVFIFLLLLNRLMTWDLNTSIELW